MKGEGRSRPLLQIEPKAQAIVATSKATNPAGVADKVLPALSQSTPTRPMPMPTHSIPLGRCPRASENRPIHNGVEATATAARPEDTHCSAMLTMPLPMPIISRPINARFLHCARVGADSPRRRRTRYISEPASRKRPPAISSGG